MTHDLDLMLGLMSFVPEAWSAGRLVCGKAGLREGWSAGRLVLRRALLFRIFFLHGDSRTQDAQRRSGVVLVASPPDQHLSPIVGARLCFLLYAAPVLFF